MGFRIEDNCVGPCPMGCIHCGRSHEHNYFCDECGDEYLEELFEYDGKELCWECYKAQYTEKICDDMDEEHCNLCNSDAEYLYLVDGSWICEQCLKSIADRVDMEV